VSFRVARPSAAVRSSSAVRVLSLSHAPGAGGGSLSVACSDGVSRVCRLDRLPSLEVGRALWRRLQAAGSAGSLVSFSAAGGFSPDRWFFDFAVVPSAPAWSLPAGAVVAAAPSSDLSWPALDALPVPEVSEVSFDAFLAA